jgi:hypothetical protein
MALFAAAAGLLEGWRVPSGPKLAAAAPTGGTGDGSRLSAALFTFRFLFFPPLTLTIGPFSKYLGTPFNTSSTFLLFNKLLLVIGLFMPVVSTRPKIRSSK